MDLEWWRPRRIFRRYYRVSTQDRRELTIFQDLAEGGWYRQRLILRESLLVVRGAVSRQEGIMNIVVQQARSLNGVRNPPQAKNWS